MIFFYFFQWPGWGIEPADWQRGGREEDVEPAAEDGHPPEAGTHSEAGRAGDGLGGQEHTKVHFRTSLSRSVIKNDHRRT